MRHCITPCFFIIYALFYILQKVATFCWQGAPSSLRYTVAAMGMVYLLSRAAGLVDGERRFGLNFT